MGVLEPAQSSYRCRGFCCFCNLTFNKFSNMRNHHIISIIKSHTCIMINTYMYHTCTMPYSCLLPADLQDNPGKDFSPSCRQVLYKTVYYSIEYIATICFCFQKGKWFYGTTTYSYFISS